MKYWHIDFEDDNYWIEVGEDGIVLRQIVSSQNGLVQVSCFEDCLAEGPFDPFEMDGKVSEITNTHFEEKWQSQIREHNEKWKHQKSLYAIGQVVIGKVLYYYPQGYIVGIGDALGCVHDVDLNCNIGDEIRCIVKNYDDQNMWILISRT